MPMTLFRFLPLQLPKVAAGLVLAIAPALVFSQSTDSSQAATEAPASEQLVSTVLSPTAVPGFTDRKSVV